MISRDEFARDFLRMLGYPIRKSNLYALCAWMQAEGGNAKFNPLNTTKKMFGSTNYNSVGVQEYTSYAQGLEATIATLKEPGHEYGRIRRHLKAGDPAPKTLAAVELSQWGTGGLALECLDQVRNDYDHWASMPIGQ